MKSTLIKILFCSILLSIIASCAPRMIPLYQLRSLTNTVADHGNQFSTRDWQKASNKFIKINKNIIKHRNRYSPSELREIAYLEGQCAALFSQGFVGNVSNSIMAVKEMIQGIKDAFNAIE